MSDGLELEIGSKIKALRLTADLTQSELADRAQLTKGFISQLENGQSSISVDALKAILDVLGVSLAEFFSESSDVKVVFSPEERVQLADKGVKKFELLVAGSTTKIMDPIYLELEPGEKLERQEPGPGQQFGYVMKGTVTLRIENNKHEVPKRHCFFFEADKHHQILNQGSGVAEVIWVTTPPRM